MTGPQWRWDATACKYRWDDSGPNPFGRGGQVPGMGWVPTGPPPGAMPPMPPPPMRTATGWGPPPGGEPRGPRGLCYRCNRPGHYIAECPVTPAHLNVATPFAAQYSSPMYYDGGSLQGVAYGSGGYTSAGAPPTPYGSGGYTSAGASPPQPSSSPSPDLANNGRSTPTFDPHLLTAHVARQGKDGCDEFFGGGTG